MDSKSKQLSVIIINLNNAKGLEKTLNSTFNQTFDDFEHIIIDGGSNDMSIEVINKFALAPRFNDSFSWVSEPDDGVYEAQNKGILKANGKYCLFLNAGDYLVNKYVLEEVFDKDHISDIIYGNLVVHFNEKLVGVNRGKENITFLDIYASKMKHQASFIKRSLFSKYGLYDESLKIVADWAFFLKTIGFNSVLLEYVDIDIACFDNNGISNNNPDLCKVERQRVLDEYLPTLMQKDYNLLLKYHGIFAIDKSKFGWFLFRILAKFFK